MALNHFSSSTESPLGGSSETVKVAAIGETTTQFLVQYGLKVHAVAKEPTAAGLLDGIRACREGTRKEAGV